MLLLAHAPYSWDDGDLTERLIVAIEGNDRWAGVFASTGAGEGGSLRPPPQVAKRDLQREIARHLFASDIRFDLEDKKVLESLAVRYGVLHPSSIDTLTLMTNVFHIIIA